MNKVLALFLLFPFLTHAATTIRFDENDWDKINANLIMAYENTNQLYMELAQIVKPDTRKFQRLSYPIIMWGSKIKNIKSFLKQEMDYKVFKNVISNNSAILEFDLEDIFSEEFDQKEERFLSLFETLKSDLLELRSLLLFY